MIYLYASLLTLFNAICLVGVAIGLPGNWMMAAAAALVAWLTWQRGQPWSHQMFHPATLIAALALALVGEALEFVAGVTGSHFAGGTRAGMWGALGGSLLGGILATFLIPIPLVGSLIGACLGAFIGALILELHSGQRIGFSLRSGSGAAAGRLLGTIAKLAVGAILWLLLAIAAFWP